MNPVDIDSAPPRANASRTLGDTMFSLLWKALMTAPFAPRYTSTDWSRPGTQAARNTMPL